MTELLDGVHNAAAELDELDLAAFADWCRPDDDLATVVAEADAAEKYQVELVHQPDPKWYPILFYIYLSMAAVYLTWRIATVNWGVWYGPTMYLVEGFGVFTTALFLAITQRIYHPAAPPNAPPGATVDALIPTYNESIEVLEATIVGAKNVRGIRRVLLLDDGNRPEVRTLAERHGIRYHPRHENLHAKAGNLNNGLRFTDAEFLLCLDADHVPVPEFLEHTLGYFNDAELAFVQTPQTYRNTESFLFRRWGNRLWSEQMMFYDTIQTAKNKANAAFFVGTSAVIRRAALDDVGGFATGTATEDIHTSLRLHASGWKSVYVPKALAYGLEAANLKEFHRQRRRWAAGSLGLLMRSPDSPIRGTGLNLEQRMNYVSATLAHIQCVQKVFFFFLPALCMFTLASPVHVTGIGAPIVLVGFPLASILITRAYSRGTYHFIYTEAYNLASLTAQFGGLWGIVKVQKKFHVSTKAKARRERTWVSHVVWGMLAIQVATLARGLDLLVGNGQAQGEGHHGLIGASLALCVVNVLVFGSFAGYLWRYERTHPGEVEPAHPHGLTVDLTHPLGETA